MAIQPVNSSMKLLLPASLPLDVPPEARAAIESLSNAIQQLQNYLEQYLGVTQKSKALWSQLRPAETLLEHQLNRCYVRAEEKITYGGFVNFKTDGAGMIARYALAKAASGLAADFETFAVGFCTTSAGVPAGEYGEFIFLRGVNLGILGVQPGVRYYLSAAIPGGITPVAPTAAGHASQFVGIGLATNILFADIDLGFSVIPDPPPPPEEGPA